VGAVGLGPVGHFPEHLARIRGPELAHPGVNALAVRQDSRIALDHGFFVHLIFAPKSPLISTPRLKVYRLKPSPRRAVALRKQFARIFLRRTGFVTPGPPAEAATR
jgi:hypothetical protein